jgi:anthranilate/para-aminobenzoate synthase component I
MIVDLLRNDLARISVPGTVAAPALFTVETYPSLHTLTSTVTAELRVGVGLRERLTALFPCGSIVGAPKVRAGEIIRELEAEPRGFYTGALGWIGPNLTESENPVLRGIRAWRGFGSVGDSWVSETSRHGHLDRQE